MKKIILFFGILFFGIISFMVSWMFFMNSGMLDSDFQMDEVRTTEIVRTFEEMPFVYFGENEPVFRIKGRIESINENSIVVRDYDKILIFEVENVSNLKIEDKVSVLYYYNENYELVILDIRTL